MCMNVDAASYIGQVVHVKVDRPLGSKHPQFDWTYPINYGFVPNTTSGDGKELDVYILGVEEPIETFRGTCIAVVERTDDDDPKLVVVPEGANLKDEEIREAVEFQEQWFDSKILRS